MCRTYERVSRGRPPAKVPLYFVWPSKAWWCITELSVVMLLPRPIYRWRCDTSSSSRCNEKESFLWSSRKTRKTTRCMRPKLSKTNKETSLYSHKIIFFSVWTVCSTARVKYTTHTLPVDQDSRISLSSEHSPPSSRPFILYSTTQPPIIVCTSSSSVASEPPNVVAWN